MADEFGLARELIAAQVRAGLTQAELAERMGTTQSVVARPRSGALAECEDAAPFCRGDGCAGDHQAAGRVGSSFLFLAGRNQVNVGP